MHKTLGHLNGNLLAAIDYETTGTNPDVHEIVQIAVVPLDDGLDPLPIRPFYTCIAPKHPEAADPLAMRINRLSLSELSYYPTHEQVEGQFLAWLEKLDLTLGRCIVPLAHNWSFEREFSIKWLGRGLFERIFSPIPRDAMGLACAVNDRAALCGENQVFNRVSLTELASYLGIENPRPHDALNDCIVEAKVYRDLLKGQWWY